MDIYSAVNARAAARAEYAAAAFDKEAARAVYGDNKDDRKFYACNPEWCRWLIGNEYENQNVDMR